MPSLKEVTYKTLPQPRQLRIDSTTFCNAKCLSCHRFLTKRKGEMPWELIERILKDVSKWGNPLEEIVPVNYGEFFLRKDWLDILIAIASKLPYTQISLATNGSLFNDDVVRSLCSIPTLRDINFSVNAYYDETYEAFNGLKADTIPKIRKAMAQIKILRPDMRLKASMVFDPMYCSDLERDYFEWYWGQAVTWNSLLNKPDTWVIPAASAGRGTPIKIPQIIPCRSIFDAIVIGYDGKISSCCFDANFSAYDLGYYSGNLLNNWHNEKFNEFRRLHSEHQRKEIPLCKECTFA